MADSFGYKADHYELSMGVGDRLRRQLRADGVRERPVVANRMSCLEHLDALLERQPRHPVELLAA